MNCVKNCVFGVVFIINVIIFVVRNVIDFVVMFFVLRSFSVVICVLGYVEKIVLVYVVFVILKSFFFYLVMDMVRKWKFLDVYSCLIVVIL